MDQAQVIRQVVWDSQEEIQPSVVQTQLQHAMEQIAVSAETLTGVVVGTNGTGLVVFKQALHHLLGSVPQLLIDRTVSPSLNTAPLNFDRYPLNQLGVDRLCNALGAFHHTKDHHRLVFDCGTYTTIEMVDQLGQFLGGAIMPGPDLFLSLWTQADFYRPEMNFQIFSKPQACPGSSTETSIQNGLYYGYKGMVVEVVSQLLTTLRWSSTTTHFMMTGGSGPDLRQLLSLEFPKMDEKPTLTLEGLYYLWLANKSH